MVSGADSRFREVDVLRGLAALTVVFSHYFPYWNRHFTQVPVLVPGALGFYAVKLFFVISGFVIFLTLERCKNVTDFAFLRFSRLYPVYWASLILVTSLSVIVFGERFWLGGVVTNATMFQQFFRYPDLDHVYWSLSVELAFYLNVAWLFALGLHRKRHRIVLAWLVLTAIWAVTAHKVGTVTAIDTVNVDERDWFALLFAFDYAPYFTLGILLYHAKRHGWTPSTVALMAMAAAVEFLLASWQGIAVICLIGLLFALSVTGYLGFLVGRATLWLGSVSYSLYLVHRNLGYYSLEWLHGHGVNAVIALAVTVVGALLLATTLTYGVERPLLSGIRTWYWRASGALLRRSAE